MTRAEQWAAFARAIVAMLLVAAITVAASIDALRLGSAAAGLLYLLPVLWVSARAGLSAGLASAATAALCYNFFLLEPRYTFRIHGLGDGAAFLVLTVVAVVTSRLAADLRLREIEARYRATVSEAEAELAQMLAHHHSRESLDEAAVGAFGRWFGGAHLFRADDIADGRTPLAPLDAAAAAWALHNGGLSGHASAVMPSADFRFVPLGVGSDDVLALEVNRDEAPGTDDRAVALARVWVQARDRLRAEGEQRAREEADAREQVRRTLLAALGHDFRTPLTVLKAGLAELDDPAAAVLAAQVERLSRLSEDLIAAARLEGGTPLALEPVDLVDIVGSVVRPERAGKPVRVDIPDDLPLVAADAVMLVHLLGNLLDNAGRHARTAIMMVARAEGGEVRLEVTDDGEGIDPAIGDRLFDPFVTGSDRRGGHGLGLAIARDLAEAMGGSLSAGAAPEGGARFALVLRAYGAVG